MRILIFAGAGTSVELGVPAMPGLATEFHAHCKQWHIEPDLVQRMLGAHNDVEYLIESLDKIDEARKSIEELGMQAPPESIHTIRSEVEWFVQHAAERVTANDARLMWGSLLRATCRHQFTFVTTNYDRSIELAANAEGIDLDDGFENFVDNEAAKWVGFQINHDKPILAKLHGSTDWYSDMATGEPRKLRHPMPLFGRSLLRLATGDELGSAMILPSREKQLTRAPYPRMSQAFLNAVDNCEAAIFIGSSFRDVHVRDQASTIARNRPVFIVNRSGSNYGVETAVVIQQSASQFLISTLPAALGERDPSAALRLATAKGNIDVLRLLRIATNFDEPADRRCSAIEELDNSSVSLDEHLIRALIASKDATVSRFALGLVATSADKSSLLASAKESCHTSDYAFAEELDLLGKLLEVTS